MGSILIRTSSVSSCWVKKQLDCKSSAGYSFIVTWVFERVIHAPSPLPDNWFRGNTSFVRWCFIDVYLPVSPVCAVGRNVRSKPVCPEELVLKIDVVIQLNDSYIIGSSPWSFSFDVYGVLELRLLEHFILIGLVLITHRFGSLQPWPKWALQVMVGSSFTYRPSTRVILWSSYIVVLMDYVLLCTMAMCVDGDDLESNILFPKKLTLLKHLQKMGSASLLTAAACFGSSCHFVELDTWHVRTYSALMISHPKFGLVCRSLHSWHAISPSWQIIISADHAGNLNQWSCGDLIKEPHSTARVWFSAIEAGFQQQCQPFPLYQRDYNGVGSRRGYFGHQLVILQSSAKFRYPGGHEELLLTD
jgi:hypothetical protein